MKYLLIAAALSLGVCGACLAQTSTPNDIPSAHSKAATAPNGPGGPAANGVQGMERPCHTQASGTSDREGGKAKASTQSAGPNNNPNGKVQGC